MSKKKKRPVATAGHQRGVHGFQEEEGKGSVRQVREKVAGVVLEGERGRLFEFSNCIIGGGKKTLLRADPRIWGRGGESG